MGQIFSCTDMQNLQAVLVKAEIHDNLYAKFWVGWTISSVPGSKVRLQ